MNWSSVKNLLIAMLFAANIFLVYNISVQSRSRSYISESELRDAVDLLSERGLEIELNHIPQRKFEADIFESLYPGDDSYYIAVASRLTGSDESDLRVYPMPDGSTRISSGAPDGEYRNIEFTKDFSFVYWSDNNPDGAAYTDITADNFENMAKESPEIGKTRLAALSKLAIAFLSPGEQDESGLTASIEGDFYDEERGLSFVLVSQRLNRTEVFRHRVVCVFRDEELVTAVGRWYFEGVGGSYDYELYDQVNILFADYGNLSSQRESAGDPLPAVTSLSSCYTTYMDSEKTALYFIPGWRIDHSDDTVIVYNAAQGTQYYSSK